MNFVALQCVCRCGLRIAFVASECPRMSSPCSLRAAAGRVLPSCRIRTAKNAVSLQCVRRCGLRIGFVASECRRTCRWPCCACPKKRLLAKAAEKEGIRAGDCFFSIGQRVLIGLCFFYRVETSAPGLSGYYWYIIYDSIIYSIFFATYDYSLPSPCWNSCSSSVPTLPQPSNFRKLSN